jgi:MFS transporter, MHS family, proline/betaine transporter
MTTPAAAPRPASPRREDPSARQIAAAVIGNALEWYDFVVYGFLTVIIAKLFFPASSDYISMLKTTATFGVGFFMRPVGGIVLGLYADRHGRKAALQLIIALMTIAIGLIALAPTYAAIGVGAPLLIMLARLLQGFATGGEFASATSFLIESAPSHRRGFYGSWQMVGQGTAALLGATSGWAVTHLLTPAQVDGWGWRLPFLFGLLIGPVGLYIRKHVPETKVFLAASGDTRARPTLLQALARHPRQILVAMGGVVCGTISYYVVLVYMPTFANKQLHLPLDQAFLAQVFGLATLTAVIPAFGSLSDRVGRKPVLIGALALYLAVLYPVYMWLYNEATLGHLILAQCLLCLFLGAFFGPISTALAEQFPARVRSTGLAVAYNVAVMLFGGFAPFIVTWLIETTGVAIAPVFYLIAGTLIGLIAAFNLDEAADESLLAAGMLDDTDEPESALL